MIQVRKLFANKENLNSEKKSIVQQKWTMKIYNEIISSHLLSPILYSIKNSQ